MSADTVITTTVGAKVYVTPRMEEDAFRDLLRAGYDMQFASDNALNICIARAEASTLSSKDFLYKNSQYAETLDLLAHMNTKLMSVDIAEEKASQLERLTKKKKK